MKTISIDDRLKSVASLVDNCDVIADIGTDHGYLAIYLIQKGITNKAYATDIAINPLNSAKENIEKYQLSEKIETILCNGLTLLPQNINCVIIAGMGGKLMIDILSNRKYDYDTYVLQANLHHYALRKYLSENGFEIIDEKVTYAHKKYYEIIKVRHGKQSLSENQLTFGPINLINKNLLFINKWKEVRQKLSNVLDDFKGSDQERTRLIEEITLIDNVIDGTITI